MGAESPESEFASMRYETGQFGSWDAKDNRREVWILFERLGKSYPEPIAAELRAKFLESLIPESVSCFANKPLKVDPCSAGQAFQLFTQITGVLGVPVQRAAILLDEFVTKQGNEHALQEMLRG
jgi:hypothetical protein